MKTTTNSRTSITRALKYFGHAIERGVREIYYSPRLYARHKTLWPDRVPLGDTGRFIHIDPSDSRARKKLLIDPLRKPEHTNVRFWREFVTHLQPGIALDVGVNYGECLFAAEYPATQAVGIDANPGLLPLLTRSRDEHPDAARISLINALVSDRAKAAEAFFVDKLWSGTSTAIADVAKLDSTRYEQYEVPCVTLDQTLAPLISKINRPTLLFKMDIEGYEYYALRGMRETIERFDTVVGFLEVDSAYTERIGLTLDEYILFLGEHFRVAAIRGRDDLIEVAGAEKLRELCGKRTVHTDLVLAGWRTEWDNVLPEGWTIAI